ncbi:hypothetical protein IFM89_003516 [Coptis chinensis]|uniref:Uncharacterized protein n=1 Tax=Coptis chinensis TaxID=261450 RepID=A0A835HC77_9MAGN|nr:hypothetical protein IFM89_003516 [Coptis chinensis]
MMEEKKICVLVLFFMLMIGSCLGRFVVEKNSLRVTSPQSLKSVYECAIGNFGVPQYGGTLIGTVVYPKANQKACKGFDEVEISFKSKPGGLPTFVLVDRGDCFFTLKAWNAQKAGAAAILVADDKVEPLITMDNPEEDKSHPDYLQNITIPSACSQNFWGKHQESSVRWRNVMMSVDPSVTARLSSLRNSKVQLKYLNRKDFSRGYDGKDVVVQNLRQACLYKVSNESGKPWLWWDYVTDFAIRCPMKDKKYTKECADQVIKSLGLDLKKIDECIGDSEADVDNPVLKAEQDAQIGKGSRGDVTILPTLVINNRQYRGKLDKGAVLKAICAGFQETTEPAVCLSDGIETNECLENNGGCWKDNAANITACKDTFRGKVCECPVVEGVKFVGDGYTHCEASGALRCEINNGGCWKKTQDGRTYSACVDDNSKGCKCPPGFKGDGIESCEDVDECKDKLACQCPECKCKNTWGSYECSCGGKEGSAQVSWRLGGGRFSSVWLLQVLVVMLCTSTGSGDTWILKFGLSWRNTCHWIIRERSQIICPMGTSEKSQAIVLSIKLSSVIAAAVAHCENVGKSYPGSYKRFLSHVPLKSNHSGIPHLSLVPDRAE